MPTLLAVRTGVKPELVDTLIILVVRVVPDFEIVNCILFVKLDPAEAISNTSIEVVPVGIVQPSNVDDELLRDIVREAFCAHAVTFNATVADTEALPFSTTDVDAVLPATLPSTVAFSLNAATTMLPAEVVPVISLHDPCPVSLNIYPLTIDAVTNDPVAESFVISKNLPFVK